MTLEGDFIEYGNGARVEVVDFPEFTVSIRNSKDRWE
jgi:hypothetical protein